MTDREKKTLKYGVISIFDKFNLHDHTATIGGLRNDILNFINSMQEEPVSEELEETIEQSFTFHDSQGDDFRSDKKIETAYRYGFNTGANWQKDRMIGNTTDAQCFGFQGAALFSFRLPADNYLVGSKVKVIVIKED